MTVAWIPAAGVALRRAAAFALVASAACDGEFRFDERPADGSADLLAAEDGGAGSGTIAGSVGAQSFSAVASALWIAAPDDPGTVVVYLFSKPVSCSTVSIPGWEGRLASAPQVLELAYFGSLPATYGVTAAPSPRGGEAAVEYVPDASKQGPRGTVFEALASGGALTLSSVVAEVRVTGTFSAQFGTEALNGTFDATFCPRGTEP